MTEIQNEISDFVPVNRIYSLRAETMVDGLPRAFRFDRPIAKPLCQNIGNYHSFAYARAQLLRFRFKKALRGPRSAMVTRNLDF